MESASQPSTRSDYLPHTDWSAFQSSCSVSWWSSTSIPGAYLSRLRRLGLMVLPPMPPALGEILVFLSGPCHHPLEPAYIKTFPSLCDSASLGIPGWIRALLCCPYSFSTFL